MPTFGTRRGPSTIATARAAGMRSVVARWGYRPDGDEPAEWGGDLMVETPRALLGGIPRA